MVGRRLGRLVTLAPKRYSLAGRVGGHMVEAVLHEIKIFRIQDRHVNHGRIGVDIPRDPGRGRRGTGSKEQHAGHPGHLCCGSRNLPGTRIVAQITARFGLDGPSSWEQRRRGVLIAGRRAQFHDQTFTRGTRHRHKAGAGKGRNADCTTPVVRILRDQTRGVVWCRTACGGI